MPAPLPAMVMNTRIKLERRCCHATEKETRTRESAGER